jgi:hypothetical protein
MKKFVSFSKLLSRRILIVNIVTISILALLVISFATVGLKNMTRAYYQSGLFASHESIEKRIGHVDSESLYRHIKRIDVGFNDFNPLFTDTNEKDDKEVWAYNIVIDSLGNYLYHPDRQRIGKGNFFDDIRQSPDALRQQLARGLATAEIGEQKITVDGVSSYIFYFGMGDAKWTNAIIVPKDGLLVPAIITGLILLTIIILGLLAAYWISRVTIHRSTKPLHAALFMTQTMSLFRAYSKDEDMPDRIVSKMNYDLNKNNESCMFVTLFVGILDLTSGLLHYSNAGHEPPVVIRSKGEKESWSKGEKEAQLLPIEPCFPVGLTTDVSYVTQTVVL